MKLAPQQLAAVELVESGAPAFITGMAGTGKSTVMAAIVGRARGRVDLCATTGIAALNLQQQFLERTGLTLTARTIYRYAGIGLGPATGQSFEDYSSYLEGTMNRSRKAAYQRIRSAQTVVIDEVSMLPGRTLDFLDHHFRRVRECAKPFGGAQIVAVGDFLQLPPVAKTGRYDWAFHSESWRGAGLVPCYLTQIFRQNEPEFIDALNDFRVGRISGRTAEVLATRVARFPSRNIPRLFTHNVQVDKWNAYQLENIEEHPERTFTARTNGNPDQIEFLTKNLVTPDTLVLKRTARVMFTANLSDGNGGMIAANGECGTVLEFDQPGRDTSAGILIRKDDGKEIVAEPFVWQFDPQDDDSAKFIQHPLRLAYSMTIHKSQGLSLDAALIDIRAAREPGQAYVALSRLRSLRGLYLKDWFSGVFVSPEAIGYYRELESRSAVAA
jgi:ATP-dependent exoDNAse (exonuclease V) alpha subunit